MVCLDHKIKQDWAGESAGKLATFGSWWGDSGATLGGRKDEPGSASSTKKVCQLLGDKIILDFRIGSDFSGTNGKLKDEPGSAHQAQGVSRETVINVGEPQRRRCWDRSRNLRAKQPLIKGSIGWGTQTVGSGRVRIRLKIGVDAGGMFGVGVRVTVTVAIR